MAVLLACICVLVAINQGYGEEIKDYDGGLTTTVTSMPHLSSTETLEETTDGPTRNLTLSPAPSAGLPLNFSSTPGVVYTYANGEAYLNWTLSENFTSQNISAVVDCNYNKEQVFRYERLFVLPGDLYKERLNFDFKNEKRLFQLSIRNITDRDVSHNYTMEWFFGEKTLHDYFTLALYGPPSTPHISASPPHPEEFQNVTLTCEASSTTVPKQYRQPLTVTWFIDGIPVNTSDQYVITEEGALHIHNLTSGEKNISCTVREGTSKYTADRYFCLQVTECVGCNSGVEPTEPDPTGSKNVCLEGPWYICHKDILIISGVVLVVLALSGGIIYLLWERRYRPDRSKRRSNAVRRSLGRSAIMPRRIDLLRGGRSHDLRGNEYDEEDSVSDDIMPDGENVYVEVRDSALFSASAVQNKLPTLPKRPPQCQPLNPQNDGNICAYAETRFDNTNNHDPLGNTGIYNDNDLTDLIQNDVNEYMVGGINSTATHNAPGIPASETVKKSENTCTGQPVYSTVNKSKKSNKVTSNLMNGPSQSSQSDEGTYLMENTGYYSKSNIPLPTSDDQSASNGQFSDELSTNKIDSEGDYMLSKLVPQDKENCQSGSADAIDSSQVPRTDLLESVYSNAKDINDAKPMLNEENNAKPMPDDTYLLAQAAHDKETIFSNAKDINDSKPMLDEDNNAKPMPDDIYQLAQAAGDKGSENGFVIKGDMDMVDNLNYG